MPQEFFKDSTTRANEMNMRVNEAAKTQLLYIVHLSIKTLFCCQKLYKNTDYTAEFKAEAN